MNNKNVTIARSYAKAIFHFSKEHNQIEYWQEILKLLSNIFCEKEIKEQLQHNIVSEKKIAELLILVLNNKINNFIKNFIKILSENKRLLLIPFILKEFKKLYYQYKNILYIKVFSANQLNEKQITILKNSLKKKFCINIKLKNEINKNIIGGFLIKINDLVIDCSIKNIINNLNKKMQS
ncbi:F0F1 ATP synthase subunit delta [Candidatus Tachikawaea gelatinosa]|nr:F0F1 ATP synthase subunit delta [Candidatus Tachikawaea gelatinosa]